MQNKQKYYFGLLGLSMIDLGPTYSH